MQYKIPQNVGIEDKIVGPLTLKQLIIVAAGCGTSYVLFAIISKLYKLNTLEYIVVALPALLAVAFALIKINDIPLTKYIFLFLEFSMKPRKRIWDHRGISSIVSPDLGDAKKEETLPKNTNALDEKARKAANLKDLTKVLDSGSFEHLGVITHKDIDTTHDDDLVVQAYFGHKRGDSETENMYWRTKESHIKMLDMFAKMPITQIKTGTKETEMMQNEIKKVKNEVSAMRQVSKKQNSKISNQDSAPVIKSQIKTKSVSKKPDTVISKSSIKRIQKVVTPVSTNAVMSNKKRRRRKRKIAQPIRTDNHINTTTKNKPAKYIPKNTPQKNTKSEIKKPITNISNGEFDLRDLKKGEIEINLD